MVMIQSRADGSQRERLVGRSVCLVCPPRSPSHVDDDNLSLALSKTSNNAHDCCHRSNVKRQNVNLYRTAYSSNALNTLNTAST